MVHETTEVPQPVRSAIGKLWRTSSSTEEGAFNSGAFRLLEVNCGSTYPAIKDSRLPQQPTTDSARKELRSALQHFFRWNGAPWYQGTSPSVDEAALKLHQAFLATIVNRSYLAPLDRLDLEDPTQHYPHKRVRKVDFGPNEVVLLSSDELGQRVRYEALKRFGRWHEFPTKKLNDFYWLIASAREEAGPIWERTWMAFFHKTWDAIGQVPVFESTYPAPIEDALFVLLLSLVKEPKEAPWAPFAVPWTYSFTDDPFAEAPRAPDPSALTWTLIGRPDEEIEVPDRSESFEITDQQLDALEQRWRKLQAALARINTDQANLHPLTKHFFVKALAEEGIDEIVANISCVEATLMLNEPKGREKMKKRYKCLLGDGSEFEWLKRGYTLRDEYLHSLGDPTATISWDDLAQTRWSVTKAVDKYLDLTEQKGDLNREGLLLSLLD